MNKARRKRLEEAMETLQTLIEEIDAIREEEQDAYDNMPESLQESERGERMYTIASTLEDVGYSLESAKDDLEETLEV